MSDFEHRPIVRKKGRPPVASADDVTRDCRRHGPTLHHRYADGRLRCKRCVGEAVTRRHQRVKRMLVAEFGGGCAVCGYSRTPYNLHFHHVDPSDGEIEAGLIESPPPMSVYREAA